jgi:hypothetical protein
MRQLTMELLSVPCFLKGWKYSWMRDDEDPNIIGTTQTIRLVKLPF